MDHSVRTESEIRTKYQITIPDNIRKKANLKVGDKLIWQYDETCLSHFPNLSIHKYRFAF